MEALGGGGGGTLGMETFGGGGGGLDVRDTLGAGGGALGRFSDEGWLDSLKPQCLHRTASIGISFWHAGHVLVFIIVELPRHWEKKPDVR